MMKMECQENQKGRDGSIECYRVFLMFGICLLHALSFGYFDRPFIHNALKFCVVGFVFISGYYGIRFSWKKIVYLYGVGIYCAVTAAVISMFVAGGVCDGGGYENVRRSLLEHGGFWFLHAYVLMMCFAPLIDNAVNVLEWRRVLPLLVVVFGWGFLRNYSVTRPFVPDADGLDAYGGITLLGIYAGARLVRVFQLDRYFKMGLLVLMLPLIAILCGLGLGEYDSPFAFAVAAILFVLFRRVLGDGRIGHWMLRGAVVAAPSMFSVYLIHCNFICLPLVGRVKNHLLFDCGLNQYCAALITALVVFMVALMADVPRRIVCYIKRRVWK